MLGEALGKAKQRSRKVSTVNLTFPDVIPYQLPPMSVEISVSQADL